MIKINLLCVGKVKEKYFLDGINEYKKRLSRFCEFNLIELEEENYSKVTDGLISQIKQKEGEKIDKKLSGYVFATAIEGKQFSSQELATKIKELIDKGQNATFIIGGSYGIDDKIKKKANELLSFSKMTFPHTMFRLILTEQIYRAFTIINGTEYHK